MGSTPVNVNQDDVFGSGVEASAFGAKPQHRNEANAGIVVEKPKSRAKWLIGALVAFALVVVAAITFVKMDRDEGSFAQVSAPRPQMDVMAAAPMSPVPEAAGANGAVVASVPPEAPPLESDPAPTDPNAAVALKVVPQVGPQSQPEASQEPAAAPRVAPVPSSAPETAVAPASGGAEKQEGVSDQQLKLITARYEALSGDHARLKQKYDDLVATRPSTQRRAQAKRVSAPIARVKPVEAAASPVAIPGVRLKAVVESNAWVQTDDGDSVMVAPGDQIPGVGQVRSVDPETGTVQLSDGRVIR